MAYRTIDNNNNNPVPIVPITDTSHSAIEMPCRPPSPVPNTSQLPRKRNPSVSDPRIIRISVSRTDLRSIAGRNRMIRSEKMISTAGMHSPNSPNPSATTVLARTAPSFPPQFCTRASLTASLEDMNTWVQSVTDWSSFQKKKNDSTDTARNSAKNSKANP